MWLEHNELGRMWKDSAMTKPEFVRRSRGKAPKNFIQLNQSPSQI